MTLKLSAQNTAAPENTGSRLQRTNKSTLIELNLLIVRVLVKLNN